MDLGIIRRKPPLDGTLTIGFVEPVPVVVVVVVLDDRVDFVVVFEEDKLDDLLKCFDTTFSFVLL